MGAEKLVKHWKLMVVLSAVLAMPAASHESLGGLSVRLKERLPLLGVWFIVGELLFVIGLIMMVVAAGSRIGVLSTLKITTLLVAYMILAVALSRLPGWFAVVGVIGLVVVTAVGTELLLEQHPHLPTPSELKEHLEDMAARAADSRWGRAGFWLNAFGAVSTGILLTVGAVLVMPPASWHLGLIGFADLSATLALRRGVVVAAKRGRAAMDE